MDLTFSDFFFFFGTSTMLATWLGNSEETRPCPSYTELSLILKYTNIESMTT